MRKIDILRKRVKELEAENKQLKSLFPSPDKVEKLEDVINKYNKAIEEVTALKAKYNALIDEVKAEKKDYSKKVNKLINRMKKEVK